MGQGKKFQSDWDLFKRVGQTQFAGFLKQSYYEKIDKKSAKKNQNYISFFFLQITHPTIIFCDFDIFPLIFSNFLIMNLFRKLYKLSLTYPFEQGPLTFRISFSNVFFQTGVGTVHLIFFFLDCRKFILIVYIKYRLAMGRGNLMDSVHCTYTFISPNP